MTWLFFLVIVAHILFVSKITDETKAGSSGREGERNKNGAYPP